MAIVQVSPVGTAEKDYDQEKKRFIKFIQDKKDSGTIIILAYFFLCFI